MDLALETFDRLVMTVFVFASWAGTIMWAQRLRRSLNKTAVRLSGGIEGWLMPTWLAWTAGIFGLLAVSDACVAGCAWEPARTVSRAGGLVLLGLGSSLVLFASVRLGGSWRIGVDVDAAGPLVTTGVYTLTRNPIFEGILVALAGIVVWMPALPLLALWATTLVLVRAQVAREEMFLSNRWGMLYGEYASRVGRWGPRMRRRP